MSRKIYTIAISTPMAWEKLLHEIKQWQVNPKTYEADTEKMVIVTRNANVVDVTTESLLPTRYTITVRKVTPERRD
jgi:hypothetical protein